MLTAEHYARLPAFVLGFHGCDAAVAEAVFRGGELRPSTNDYDWIGSGTYFWENNYERAMEWARAMARAKGARITTPAVIGAVIDLGNCLNFLDQTAIALAKDRYGKIADEYAARGEPLPRNVNPKTMAGSKDRIVRRLDRAVVEAIHDLVKEQGGPAFDSVRAVFLEGRELYAESGFLEKTHVQICVRNQRNILGYFRPRV